MTEYISLSELTIGSYALVVDIKRNNTRFNDLGINLGTQIKAIMRSPLGDPTAYLIRGAVFALRNEDAKNIFVERI